MRSSPIYGAGGKVVHLKGTQLQCGVLQTDIVNPSLTEKCSFKVIGGDEVEVGRAVGGAGETGGDSAGKGEMDVDATLHLGEWVL